VVFAGGRDSVKRRGCIRLVSTVVEEGEAVFVVLVEREMKSTAYNIYIDVFRDCEQAIVAYQCALP
jgi:hypothetical protein